jgi:hypothetical protein
MGLLGFLGGKNTFQSWTGDSNASTSASKILMNGPRIVQAKWGTDDSQAYTYLDEIAVVVIIAMVLAVIVLTRRGRRRTQQPQPKAPQGRLEERLRKQPVPPISTRIPIQKLFRVVRYHRSISYREKDLIR